MGRGKAVLVVHDKSESRGGGAGFRAYRMSEGMRGAGKEGRWDGGR